MGQQYNVNKIKLNDMEKYKNKIIGALIISLIMKLEMIPGASSVFLLSATTLAIYYFNKK